MNPAQGMLKHRALPGPVAENDCPLKPALGDQARQARRFGCPAESAWRSMRMLAGAESLLRASRLPQLCYRGALLLDGRLRHRFNYYLRETAGKMGQINRILSGESPLWHAESPCMETTRARIGLCMPHQVRGRMPLPQDLFQIDSDAMASVAPIAAPASTSLG